MIRKFKIEDKDIYLEMSKSFYSSDAVLHNIPDEYINKTFDEILSGNPFTGGYVYETEGKVVGYSLLAFTYSNEAGGLVLWIEEVYIKPEYRGNGFGKSLLAFIYSTYKTKVARIRLEVEESNKRAIKLYKNLGFKPLDYQQMFKKISQ